MNEHNDAGGTRFFSRGRAVLLAIFCLAAVMALYGWNTTRPFRLTILHTNDVHANYGGSSEQGGFICYKPACPRGTGGSIRLKRAVSAARQQEPDALFLDAGDQFQGTLFWTLHKEAATVAVMNRLGYDAMVPGNHEFDAGCGPFLALLQGLGFPVAAANLTLDIPQRPEAQTLVKPWIILERRGRLIGVTGLANAGTALLSSSCAGARFSDEAGALQKAVQELSARGVDIIIALTHVGLARDRELARTVSGVDVIVGGHSHSLLANTFKEAQGPYPVVETSPEGRPVLVTQAGANGEFLGRLTVTFDARGVPVAWEGEPILLKDQVLEDMRAPGPDPALASAVEAHARDARELMREPVGEIQAREGEGRPLERAGIFECRQGECLTANVVTEALLRIPFEGAEAVILNAGALRNPLPGGAVARGDILSALPFENMPILAQMPGTVLLAALEHGAAFAEAQGGGLLHTAGLRYGLDMRNPAGTRVTRAEIRNPDGSWRTVIPGGLYRVVSVDYLGRGGDGYSMLTGLGWSEAAMPVNDVLAGYLKRHSPLRPRLDGRLTVIR